MNVSIRKLNGKDTVHLCGYVNAVERESRELPPVMAPYGATDKPFFEIVRAGVFTKALHENPNVGFMFNHEQVLPDKLQLNEDAIGLYAEAETSEPAVVSAAKAGKLRGWSFGFDNERDEWKDCDDGKRRRYLTSLHLREVSILTETPAYVATTVSVRSDGAEPVTVQYRSSDEEVTTAEGSAVNDNNNTNTARAYHNLYELLRLKGEM